MKTKAIECTNAQQMISNIMGSLRGNKPFRPFQTTQQPNTRQGSQGQWRGQQQGQQNWGTQPQFNLSNALPFMNNKPVPMDVGQMRNPNYRGRGRGYRGSVAQTQRPNS